MEDNKVEHNFGLDAAPATEPKISKCKSECWSQPTTSFESPANNVMLCKEVGTKVAHPTRTSHDDEKPNGFTSDVRISGPY
jgi:hypothetical protein